MTHILRPVYILIVLFIVFQSCVKDSSTDPFLVSNRQIGLLTDSTQVKDLKVIFSNDSIENDAAKNRFTGVSPSIKVFDKTGKQLLTLSPERLVDSTATINTVKIEDPRYQTAKGISINSTFGELNAAYKIKKVDNLIKTIVISVESLSATFTIDKGELPANMRFDRSLNIDPIQIPEKAKIKYFMLHW
jgi:hypothetical protein